MTPEDIRKGLVICSEARKKGCRGCPYIESHLCLDALLQDTITRMEQLEHVIANPELKTPKFIDCADTGNVQKVEEAKAWLKTPERFPFIARKKLILFDYIFWLENRWMEERHEAQHGENGGTLQVPRVRQDLPERGTCGAVDRGQ